MIDPASGHGNFIVEIVNKKLNSGLTPVEAVSTTFGVDIMQDNIDESHTRVINLLRDRGESFSVTEIREILRTRIVLNNSLINKMEDIFAEVV